MLRNNRKTEHGFTITELLIAAVLIGILMTAVVGFFWSSFNSFATVQETEMSQAEKSRVLQRMTQVIRSGTTISEATDSSFTVFAYFSPQDQQLSQVQYSYNATAKTFSVSRIPASGTAPNYTYPVANKQTTVLLDNTVLELPIFTYRDANGSNGPFTADTYKDIKGMTITIASPAKKYQSRVQLTTNVELRNRKTNL